MKKNYTLVAIMFILVFGITILNTTDIYGFTDLEEDNQKTEYIEDFSNRGLINGYADGTFRPKANITRAEFLTLINRTFGFLEEVDTEIVFSDVNPQDWYIKDLKIALSKGYIKGYVDNTFRPQNNISRQEAAVIINRILQYEPLNYYELEDEIASWAKEDVYALLNVGIFLAPEGRFYGDIPITREDSVVSLLTVLRQKELEETLEQPVEENNSIEEGAIGGGGGGATQPPTEEDETPPADIIYAMNMTIEGLERVALQQNKYSQALDNNQLDIVDEIKENMENYLDDYSYDYEGQAKVINTRYKALTEEEQNQLRNAISYDVAYKYLSTLEKYFRG